MAAAARKHGSRVRILNYTALVRDRVAEFSRVFSAKELRSFGRREQKVVSNLESLEKYRSTLSPEQIRKVNDLEEAEPMLV